MNDSILLGIAALITAAGGWYATRSNARNTKLAAELEKVKTDVEAKAEVIKTETLAKADVIKVESDADTKRLDQLLVNQNKFIDRLEGSVNKNEKKLEDLQKKLEICLEAKVEESAKFQTQITDLKITIKEEQSMLRQMQEKIKEYQTQADKVLREGIKSGILPDRRKGGEHVTIEHATIEGKRK